MMSKFMTTDAVYWDPPEDDGFGKKIWNLPKQIKVKWDYKSNIWYFEQGGSLSYNSIIWANVRIEPSGYIWKGKIEELTSIINREPDFDFTSLEYKYSDMNLMKLDVMNLATSIIRVDYIEHLSTVNKEKLYKAYTL